MLEKIQTMCCLPILIIFYSKMKHPSTVKDFTLENQNFLLFPDAKESMELQHMEMTWDYLCDSV
jgi:hypothetical protein